MLEVESTSRCLPESIQCHLTCLSEKLFFSLFRSLLQKELFSGHDLKSRRKLWLTHQRVDYR